MMDEGLPIALVASDRPCTGLQRAKEAGASALLVARDSFGADFDRHGYTQRMVEALQEQAIDLVAMAGFGTVFAEPMQKVYGGRILNTHPSLLPAFPGWHPVRDALAYGAKVTGCTVHVATLEVDTGPILAQEAVPVLPDDTEESLHERIKVVERRLYPATIKAILERGSVL